MSPLSPANFDSAYTSMIAGAIPLHSGDVDKTVFMIAQDVLGTAKMHLLVATDPASQMVYYFAAPSVAFTSIAVFATPLAAALPSHPQHQGDGIYFLQDVNLAVAVEKTRDQIRVVANSNEAMADWLAERPEMPLYRVEEYEAWAMESIPGAYRRLADGISLRTAKYSSVIAVVSLLVYFIASLGTSIQSAAADKSNQAHMAAINSAVTKIDFVSPMSQQVARMQRVSALVVRAGGWIEEYEVKDGTEKFVLMMPAWITKDYIDALGPKVEADQANEENLVRLSMGMPVPGTTPVKRPLPMPAIPYVPGDAPGSAPATGPSAMPAAPDPARAPLPPPRTSGGTTTIRPQTQALK
ncbi:MAG: hypothetical protein V4695_00035 [Pseudomonadota bacterium]